MKNIFKRKSVKIISLILAVIVILLIVLQVGTVISTRWKAFEPDYEMKDISPILNKDVLLDDDYRILFDQTGLGKLGIDGLLKENGKQKILAIQKQFFKRQEYEFFSFAPFMGYMKRCGESEGSAKFAILENGDILYSPSTFLSFIRMGHSAIVTNADSEQIVQASGYGIPSKTLSAHSVFVRPAFAILRVKTSETTRNEVAEYVLNELMGIDYDIFAGIFGEKARENLTTTHCSHIIWYAYEKFGIDIDYNGGKIVTPDDILKSNKVSVVQLYGMNPKDFDII